MNPDSGCQSQGGLVGLPSPGVQSWSGLLKEVFTDTDNFGIQFPLDMDVKMKAVLLGTCFLIVSIKVLNYLTIKQHI